MTDQRQHADAGAADGPRSSSRRAVVLGLGAGVAAALAGCNGSGRQYAYESGEVGDVEGAGRNASEMSAAEAVAEREIDESLSPLDAIDLEDHEFVLEDGYEGSTVQGTLTNAGDERLRDVEVRVRVYDAEDRHRGRFVASTGDLPPGTSWEFTVILLVAPEDVGGYDIAALGMTA